MLGEKRETTIQPVKCPRCHKVLADWLRGQAGYTCPKCGLKFELDTDELIKSHCSLGGLDKL